MKRIRERSEDERSEELVFDVKARCGDVLRRIFDRPDSYYILRKPKTSGVFPTVDDLPKFDAQGRLRMPDDSYESLEVLLQKVSAASDDENRVFLQELVKTRGWEIGLGECKVICKELGVPYPNLVKLWHLCRKLIKTTQEPESIRAWPADDSNDAEYHGAPAYDSLFTSMKLSRSVQISADIGSYAPNAGAIAGWIKVIYTQSLFRDSAFDLVDWNSLFETWFERGLDVQSCAQLVRLVARVQEVPDYFFSKMVVLLFVHLGSVITDSAWDQVESFTKEIAPTLRERKLLVDRVDESPAAVMPWFLYVVHGSVLEHGYGRASSLLPRAFEWIVRLDNDETRRRGLVDEATKIRNRISSAHSDTALAALHRQLEAIRAEVDQLFTLGPMPSAYDALEACASTFVRTMVWRYPRWNIDIARAFTDLVDVLSIDSSINANRAVRALRTSNTDDFYVSESVRHIIRTWQPESTATSVRLVAHEEEEDAREWARMNIEEEEEEKEKEEEDEEAMDIDTPVPALIRALETPENLADFDELLRAPGTVLTDISYTDIRTELDNWTARIHSAQTDAETRRTLENAFAHVRDSLRSYVWETHAEMTRASADEQAHRFIQWARDASDPNGDQSVVLRRTRTLGAMIELARVDSLVELEAESVNAKTITPSDDDRSKIPPDTVWAQFDSVDPRDRDPALCFDLFEENPVVVIKWFVLPPWFRNTGLAKRWLNAIEVGLTQSNGAADLCLANFVHAPFFRLTATRYGWFDYSDARLHPVEYKRRIDQSQIRSSIEAERASKATATGSLSSKRAISSQDPNRFYDFYPPYVGYSLPGAIFRAQHLVWLTPLARLRLALHSDKALNEEKTDDFDGRVLIDDIWDAAVELNTTLAGPDEGECTVKVYGGTSAVAELSVDVVSAEKLAESPELGEETLERIKQALQIDSNAAMNRFSFFSVDYFTLTKSRKHDEKIAFHLLNFLVDLSRTCSRPILITNSGFVWLIKLVTTWDSDDNQFESLWSKNGLPSTMPWPRFEMLDNNSDPSLLFVPLPRVSSLQFPEENQRFSRKKPGAPLSRPVPQFQVTLEQFTKE